MLHFWNPLFLKVSREVPGTGRRCSSRQKWNSINELAIERPSVKTLYAKKIVILYYAQFPALKRDFRGNDIKKVLIRRRFHRNLATLQGQCGGKTFFKETRDLQSKSEDDGLESELGDLSETQCKVIHALTLLEDRYKGNEHELYQYVSKKYGLPTDQEYKGKQSQSLYQRRMIDLYRTKYSKLKKWRNTEILGIFQRERLRRKLEALGPARVLTAGLRMTRHVM